MMSRIACPSVAVLPFLRQHRLATTTPLIVERARGCRSVPRGRGRAGRFGGSPPALAVAALVVSVLTLSHCGGVAGRESACEVVRLFTHGPCNLLLGVVFDGRDCVWESGCGCEPDCEHFFYTMEDCQAACF